MLSHFQKSHSSSAHVNVPVNKYGHYHSVPLQAQTHAVFTHPRITLTLFHSSFSNDFRSYPINRLRNIAVSNAPTDALLCIDADFIPSPGLYQHVKANVLPRISAPYKEAHLSTLPTREVPKIAYVIPSLALVEDYCGDLPKNMPELRKLVRDGIAYITDSGAGHGPTKYETFLSHDVFPSSYPAPSPTAAKPMAFDSGSRTPAKAPLSSALTSLFSTMTYMLGRWGPVTPLDSSFADSGMVLNEKDRQLNKPAEHPPPTNVSPVKVKKVPATAQSSAGIIKASPPRDAIPAFPAPNVERPAIPSLQMYEVCYESQWEPYYVVSRSATPAYDERFSNQGGDKQAHALLMNALGYRFFVVRDHFMVHLDHSRSMKWPGGGLIRPKTSDKEARARTSKASEPVYPAIEVTSARFTSNRTANPKPKPGKRRHRPWQDVYGRDVEFDRDGVDVFGNLIVRDSTTRRSGGQHDPPGDPAYADDDDAISPSDTTTFTLFESYMPELERQHGRNFKLPRCQGMLDAGGGQRRLPLDLL